MPEGRGEAPPHRKKSVPHLAIQPILGYLAWYDPEESGTPIVGKKEKDVAVKMSDPNLKDELRAALVGKKQGDVFQVELPHGDDAHAHTHTYTAPHHTTRITLQKRTGTRMTTRYAPSANFSNTTIARTTPIDEQSQLPTEPGAINGGLMRYIPCFCGCNGGSGHMNNRDCYVQAVHPDGSVTVDSMAPT